MDAVQRQSPEPTRVQHVLASNAGREPNVRALINPGSVAVLGAVPPREHAKLASKPIANLQRYGFAGPIYPVNPSFPAISGLPCYPSLSAIHANVECVMFLRRAELAVETIREMGELGIPAAIVCSGGFAETGPAGAQSQAALAQAATAAGVSICGPNTNGILNMHTGMVLGFHPLLEKDEKVHAGNVSIVSHSGTVTGAIMARLQRLGAGFGCIVSAGNEATVQAADYMHYLASDLETATVVLYLEQVRDGPRFRLACEELRQAGKTVIALKAGASDDAARVAFGHTGALVGSHTAFAAAARGYGIAVAEGLEELVALTLAAREGQGQATRKIVGLSMSGGLSGLLADAAARTGAEFYPLPDETVARLREVVPISSPTNPFDLTGLAVDNPGTLDAVLEILRDGTDADEFVFSLGLMPDATWPAWSRVCGDFAASHGVRLSVYAAAGRSAADGYEYFERAGMPVYDAVEPMLRALVLLADRDGAPEASGDRSDPVPQPPASVPPEAGWRQLLSDWGLPYVPYAYTDRSEAAVSAAAAMGYPVAMKVASAAIAHKAKLGLIALDVASDDAARTAFEQIERNFASLRGQIENLGPIKVEVQKMLPRGGFECFLGGTVDPTFGPVVTVGLGGVMVEAIGEVASALAPLNLVQAHELVSRNPALDRALSGSLDRDALILIISRFSDMLMAVSPYVDEVECNPVVVYSNGAYIVDDLWHTKHA